MSFSGCITDLLNFHGLVGVDDELVVGSFKDSLLPGSHLELALFPGRKSVSHEDGAQAGGLHVGVQDSVISAEMSVTHLQALV